MRHLVLSALAVLIAVPWLAAQDKKDESKLDLFPLAKGTKWEYEVAVAGQTKKVLQEVTKVAPGKKGERDIVTVDSKIDEQTISEEVSADDKGVYRHAMQAMKLETPLPIVKYPYATGAKWKEAIKIGTDEAVADFEAMKPEEVKVTAGKYTAYPVVMTLNIGEMKVDSKNWHADGVGIVKQEVEFGATKVVMELKKFTKGQ